MKKIAVFLAALAAAVPVEGFAQTPAPAAATCDVAVWTTTVYAASNLGLTFGGALANVGKVDEKPEINSSNAMERMLPPSELFKAVSTSRLPEILGRPVNFIQMDKPKEQTKLDRKNKARSSGSTNPCYLEVYISRIAYQSAPLHGERIFSWFALKDFRGPKLVQTGGYDNGQMEKFSKQDLATATEMTHHAVQEVFEKIAAKKFGPKAATAR